VAQRGGRDATGTGIGSTRHRGGRPRVATRVLAELLQLPEHHIQAHRVAGLDRFHHGDLEVDFPGDRIPQPPFRRRQHFENPGHRVGGRQTGLLAQCRRFGVRNLQQTQIRVGHLVHHQVAEMEQQIVQQTAQVLAALRQRIKFLQRRPSVGNQDGPGQRQDLRARRQTEHRQHILLLNGLAAKTDQLIQRALRIAHSAIRTSRHSVQGPFRNRHALGLRDRLQVTHNQARGNPAQVEPLAARQNRRQDFLRVGGGE
jgi:hypothetical protein